MTRFRRVVAAAAALLGTLCLAQTAAAQAIPAALPPANLLIDERGVDLSSGALHVDVPVLSIGPEDGGLTETFSLGSSVGRARGRIDFKTWGTAAPLKIAYQVTLDGVTKTFLSPDPIPYATYFFDLTDTDGTGTRLVRTSADPNTITFYAADGTMIRTR